jgi:hypothetical protein
MLPPPNEKQLHPFVTQLFKLPMVEVFGIIFQIFQVLSWLSFVSLKSNEDKLSQIIRLTTRHEKYYHMESVTKHFLEKCCDDAGKKIREVPTLLIDEIFSFFDDLPIGSLFCHEEIFYQSSQCIDMEQFKWWVNLLLVQFSSFAKYSDERDDKMYRKMKCRPNKEEPKSDNRLDGLPSILATFARLKEGQTFSLLTFWDYSAKKLGFKEFFSLIPKWMIDTSVPSERIEKTEKTEKDPSYYSILELTSPIMTLFDTCIIGSSFEVPFDKVQLTKLLLGKYVYFSNGVFFKNKEREELWQPVILDWFNRMKIGTKFGYGDVPKTKGSEKDVRDLFEKECSGAYSRCRCPCSQPFTKTK